MFVSLGSVQLRVSVVLDFEPVRPVGAAGQYGVTETPSDAVPACP